MKEGWKNMQPNRQRHQDPKKRQPNGRSFFQK